MGFRKLYNVTLNNAFTAVVHLQADVAKTKMSVECELPNSSLYTFTGNLIMDGVVHPLTPNQVLLRGCMLRNTDQILGVAIFTGHETKVSLSEVLSSTRTP